MRRVLLSTATAAVLTVATSACLGSGTTITTTPISTSAAAPEATTSSSAAPAAVKAGIGGTIHLVDQDLGDDIQITLVKVVDPAAPKDDIFVPDAGNHYVAIQLRIVNKGTKPYSDDPQIITKAKDELGESFDPESADTKAGVSMDSGLTLAPGDTALGFITFQVPNGKKVTQVQYTTSPFGGNVAQWTVG